MKEVINVVLGGKSPFFYPIFQVSIILFSQYKKWERFKIFNIIALGVSLPKLINALPLKDHVSPQIENSLEIVILSSFLLYFSYKEKLDDKYYILAFFFIVIALVK